LFDQKRKCDEHPNLRKQKTMSFHLCRVFSFQPSLRWDIDSPRPSSRTCWPSTIRARGASPSTTSSSHAFKSKGSPVNLHRNLHYTFWLALVKFIGLTKIQSVSVIGTKFSPVIRTLVNRTLVNRTKQCLVRLTGTKFCPDNECPVNGTIFLSICPVNEDFPQSSLSGQKSILSSLSGQDAFFVRTTRSPVNEDWSWVPVYRTVPITGTECMLRQNCYLSRKLIWQLWPITKLGIQKRSRKG